MTVEWQKENPEGTLWSATMADGQQGWFESQIERSSRWLGLGRQP